jgi:hypothetical protein
MSAFDYNAEAELFPSRGVRRHPVGYRRFTRAAEAIRFAIEELPAQALAGAWLEVDEERFDAAEIRRLYERADYPLERRPPPPASPSADSAHAGRSSPRLSANEVGRKRS